MYLTIISTIMGFFVGVTGCYIWREKYMRQQLQQILSVMEISQQHEDISLPMVSQLRRQAAITSQQQRDLEQQITSWQNTLEQAPVGYLQLDDENQILFCNQMAKDLLCIQNSESGKPRLLLELVRSYELDRLIGQTRSTQTAKQLIWQFYSGYHNAADSQSIWLKANSIPFVNGKIGIFIESQQSQVEAVTMRERWLADLSHEIRTPLTSMRLIAETLETKVTPNLTRWVQRMLQETNRLIDLVQHFLELSQLETSPTEHLSLTDVNLVDVIDDAWHSLEPIARQRKIEFNYAGIEELILRVDRSKFTQVFINLFDNSIKHCPDGGKISISLKLLTASVEINFCDNGSGFMETDLPYVFDRLYRGDLSRQRSSADDHLTKQPTGSGLGLSIVRQIILAHGGSVIAENHPNTGGARIKIVLCT